MTFCEIGRNSSVVASAVASRQEGLGFTQITDSVKSLCLCEFSPGTHSPKACVLGKLMTLIVRRCERDCEHLFELSTCDWIIQDRFFKKRWELYKVATCPGCTLLSP